MNIKNEILNKLGLDPKPRTSAGTQAIQNQTPPQPQPGQTGKPQIEERIDSGNARVNRKSSVVNASERDIRPSTFDWRNATTNREPRGKVAHLPPAIRHQVCEWISEGVTLEQIAKNLAEIGHPGFNHKNISNWKENGYRTWCQHQERHERARLRAENTMTFASEHIYSDALVAAAEIDAANALEDANLAYDPHADEDSQLKQTKIILNKTRSFTLVNSQRQRSRKLTFQEQCYRDKREPLPKAPPETAAVAPTNEEDQRKAFLKLVDKWLGIKSLPDQTVTQTTGASRPRESGARPQAEHPDQSSTTTPQENIPPSALATLRSNPADSESTHSPEPGAASDKSAPGETSAPQQNQPQSHLELSGTIRNGPAGPIKTQTPVEEEDDAWERLLSEPSLTPAFIPKPEPPPRPYGPGAQPLKELPIPSVSTAYPPAPLLQPENKLAVCNCNGVITAWVHKSDEYSKDKPWIQSIKNHTTGQIVCWFEFHSRPPGMTDTDAVRGRPHFIPVFDTDGHIINWAPEPEGKYKRPPTLTAIALEAEYPRTHFAWLEPAPLPPKTPVRL